MNVSVLPGPARNTIVVFYSVKPRTKEPTPNLVQVCIVRPSQSFTRYQVAPVVQVDNLEFYLVESWVRAPGGSDFDFIFKKINKIGFNC